MTDWLIIGYGDIGNRVAKLGKKRSFTICGAARQEKDQARLDQFLTLDLDQDLEQELDQYDGIFYFAPPPAEGEQDSRMRRFLDKISEDNQPKKIVYISTTAVYGDNQGEWIDETMLAEPGSARGKRRLHAEHQLASKSSELGFEHVILRVTGIYSQRRLPIDRVKRGMKILDPKLAGPSNRIHADDLALICVAAMERASDGTIYNVSDGKPGTMSEYFLAIAEHFRLEQPVILDWEQAEKELSPAMLGYLKETRKISNQKMLNELQIKLQHPDFNAWLAQQNRSLN